MPTTLPIAEPVLIFALAMTLFLLAPVIFERMKVPGIIGLIVAGAVVGPNVLGLLERDFTFQLLGEVGLLYLVFLAGLELDLNRFNEYRRQSVLFGILSFSAPMLLSLAVMPQLGFGLPAALLVGAIIGSHTLLAYPVASRLGVIKNPAMVTVVGGTLVTDTLALSVLAVVAGSLEGELSPRFWVTLFGVLAIYAGVVLWTVPRIGRWFFRNVPGQAPAEFIFLMAVLFTTAWAADLAGAEPIIGAFLAGLTLNRLIPLNSPLMTRIRFVGNALFIPFFLLSVGMLVDPRVMVEGWEVWTVAGALIVMVHAGKFAGAWASRYLFGYSTDEGMAMFGLSVPQAAATLAVTFVGLEIGLFEETVVNAVIIMIVATVFVGPSLVERFGRRIALQEERKPYDPASAPRRVLIPISNPATADALLDIAFILRGEDSEEPVHPLMVVRGGEQGAEAQVAEAEKMLSHAVIYAAAADIPVTPLTRVDRNPATGISRAVEETRSSFVVVGWDGTAGRARGAVFGTVLDQLLERTKQLVVVARMGHPLNTTRRLVLVLPPASDRQPGFFEAISLMKRFAAELDASVEAIVVSEPEERYRTEFERIKPQVPSSFREVEGWGPLLWELRTLLEPEDLVAVLSARRGTVSWHRELEQLPSELSRLVPESFMMLYPAQVPVEQRQIERGRELLPTALQPERVVFGIDESEPHAAFSRILRESLDDPDPDRVQAIVDRLVQSEREFSSEIRPGIALPHTLVPELDEPTMCLGLAPEGVELPLGTGPARAIFILLSPPAMRSDHLRILTQVARTLRGAEDADSLLEAEALEEIYEWFREHGPRPRSRGGA